MSNVSKPNSNTRARTAIALPVASAGKPDRLRRILTSLLDSAEAQPLSKFKAVLGHGLTIKLYLTRSHTLHLLLVREGISPSAAEWKTVLDHWPRPLPPEMPKPRPLKTWRAYGLAATWAQPKQLTLEGETDAHQTP